MLFFFNLSHTISMRYFLIGIAIGIGKILPGVSGAIIAIRFNVYEKIINAILNYFKDIKKNTIFLISIFSGVILAIVLFSNIILFFYNQYHLLTVIVFTILIASGLKEIKINSNNHYLAIITFILSILVLKLPFKYNIGYFMMGIIEAISIIVPGVSGTAIYISLGVYDKMLNLFITFPIKDLIVFSFGFIISSFVLLKLIAYLFLKYKKETYSAILGFLYASIILMFI